MAGNLIGTKANGDEALGNGRSIENIFGPDSTRIGTNGDGVSDAAEANVIAGNGRGIDLNSVTQTVIAGNLLPLYNKKLAQRTTARRLREHHVSIAL